MKNIPSSTVDPIAVIGAACRFPGGADTLEQLWSLLESGTDAVTSLPKGRFSRERFISANRNLAAHGYTLAAGVISHVHDFDPDVFGISPKEAADMDPQQRLALELSREVLENAGIVPSRLRGSATGVFMGASNVDFILKAPDDPALISAYSMTGTNLSIIANRVSHLFDLRGPSLTVDTACSSSLVALHLACESLRQGTTSLAIAGGVNVLLTPYAFIGFSKARMLSPDGRCKVFDASGNGYVRSEGGGAVLLKPLTLALRDRDDILAVIAGSGVNSDGHTTGIALPNKEAQTALLAEVYTRFHLDKHKLVYVEAHGTGTAAGDPMEAGSIGTVLGTALKGKRPLPVGSVKTNIGHLEPASGMAGIMKAILVLRHGKIPPNLHFKEPNPAIDFAALNLVVPQKLIPLPRAGGEELISVNSFGFGGANAHVVLRRPPRLRKRPLSAERGTPLPPLFFSAASGPSLADMALLHAEHLRGKDVGYIYDYAATLALHREHLPLRAVLQEESAEALCHRLESLAASVRVDPPRPAVNGGKGPGKSIFAFAGNGSQYPGMGRHLFEHNAVFQESLEEVDALLSNWVDWSLVDIIQNPDTHADAFSLTETSQPLLFALQVGLVRALEAKGLSPSGVMGHSFGEIPAAWAAGALSLKDATTVIHFRSSLQAPLRGRGLMAVANLREDEARELLRGYGGSIAISAVNTPASLTLSGCDQEALADFVEMCRKRKAAAKLLDLPYPFHTEAIDALRGELLRALSGIKPRKPRLPFYSTVAGRLMTEAPGPEYWFANLRQPVLFAQAAQSAYADGCRLYAEIGAKPILRSYLRKIFEDELEPTSVEAMLTGKEEETRELEAAWRNAWQRGWHVDQARHFPHPYAKCALPAYAWNRERLWNEPTPESNDIMLAERVHPLLGWQLPGKAAVFENTLCPADFPWLQDHVAGHEVVYPAAAFLESMLAAAALLHPGRQVELERVAILKALPLADAAPRAVRLSVDKEDGGLVIEGRAFMSEENWSLHAKARIPAQAGTPPDPGLSFAAPESFGMAVSKENLYKTAERFLLRYGPAFRTVSRAWVRPEAQQPEVLAEFSDPDPKAAEGMHIPPTLMDGAMQSLFILLGAQDKGKTRAYLPVSFDRVILYRDGSPRFAHTRLDRVGPRSVLASFRLLDESGETLLAVRRCRFHRALWLEREHTASEPYVLELLPQCRPDVVLPLAGVSPRTLARESEAEIDRALTPGAETAGSIHPYMLLQLTALSSAHESVLSLCGAPVRRLQCGSRELVESGALGPEQEAWFSAMLERLEGLGLAARANNMWRVQPLGERMRAETLWRTIVGNFPGYLPEATLLAHVFRRHAAILSGEYGRDEDSILKPQLVESYYTDSTLLHPYAAAALHCLEATLRAAERGQVTNILHISRNPAAFLPSVLPLLAGPPCRYVVAEKDEAAAEEHARAFGPNPSLVFTALNPEAPEAEHLGKYHLILLTWSLHSYRDTNRVLEHCRDMLAPGGLICVLEHAPSAFTDYVFGCLPSWWADSQELGMPVSLLQHSGYWQECLEKAGFKDTTATGKEDDSFRPAFLLLAGKDAVGEFGVEEAAGREPSAVTPQASAEAQNDDQGHWILITAAGEGSDAHLARLLRDQMRAEGQTPRIVTMPIQDGNGPRQDDWWRALLADCPEKADSAAINIVFLAGYSSAPDVDAAQLMAMERNGLSPLAALVRVWETARTRLNLWVVSNGAITDGMADAAPSPCQGALAGFVRVLANEARGLSPRLVDIHGAPKAGDGLIPAVAREMLSPVGEPEVVFSRKGRYVPRLNRFTPKADRESSLAPRSAALRFDYPGRVQNLYWADMPRPEPGPDQVCVEVKYTGLNFRDVMWSLGNLPDAALENGFSGPSLGLECSGIVRSVGRNVQQWRPGDEVICFTAAGFSSHVLTSAAALARKPAEMSFAEGATVPVAFMTAWYSLKHLARMRPGESVLIHGAAGGVGLAAIQIATHLGLHIYATAGAPQKHNFLRHLGIKRLFSSRSLAFRDQILGMTDGRGVDAVINSLAGEYMTAGLSVLRPFGRFLELGKRDFFEDRPLRLQPLANNISYFGIDVDQLLIHQPELAQSLFQELIALFEQRKLAPLPYTIYPATRCVDAFQSMQHSRHIGKVVVSLKRAESVAKAQEAPRRKLQLRPDGAYLVTGGTSGLGLASAARLARRGAKHLILLSRGGVKNPDDQRMVDLMRKKGIKVALPKVDVADAAQLAECLDACLKDMPPLRGVIHAAAVLDDGLIQGLDEARLATSMRAKCLGAINLHQYSLGKPLDFFALYSSAAAPFGNPGQGAYVAANSLLESLGAWRRARGLPAQVMGWGPIADTGMITRNPKAKDMLHKVLGISPTASADALYWMEHCLAANVGQSYYFGLDWQSRAHLPALDSPRNVRLRPKTGGNKEKAGPTVEEILALGRKKGTETICGMLIDEICRLLRLPGDRITPSTPLVSQGMDSLMTQDIGIIIEQKFGLEDYRVALSENATPLSLADALYLHLGSSRESDEAAREDTEKNKLRALERQHGFQLSEQELEDMARSMAEPAREHK